MTTREEKTALAEFSVSKGEFFNYTVEFSLYNKAWRASGGYRGGRQKLAGRLCFTVNRRE